MLHFPDSPLSGNKPVLGHLAQCEEIAKLAYATSSSRAASMSETIGYRPLTGPGGAAVTSLPKRPSTRSPAA
jgi:hypothetical protein